MDDNTSQRRRFLAESALGIGGMCWAEFLLPMAKAQAQVSSGLKGGALAGEFDRFLEHQKRSGGS